LSELILDYKPGRIDEDTTFNLGVVSAGDAVNTVPAHLTIEGDIRSTDDEMAQTFRSDLKDYLQRLAKTHDLTLELSWNDYCQAYEIDTTTNFYSQVQGMYADIGIALEPTNTTSASDAAHLRAHGVEALCLGDGVKNPHEVSEHIEVKTLEKLVEIYNHLIKKESNE
jgi:tripeptide aminopeptidase